MGVSAFIDFDSYPKQGRYLKARTRVVFKYDTSREVQGTIIRDDIEGDGLTIIQLDDGRVVLGSECQYSPWPAPAAA